MQIEQFYCWVQPCSLLIQFFDRGLVCLTLILCLTTAADLALESEKRTVVFACARNTFLNIDFLGSDQL